MKKLALILVACLSLAGCADEYEGTPVAVSPTSPAYGCVVVTDEYGEREVCNTRYYYSDGGVVYWDEHFGIWVGPNGYYRGGVFFPGIYPGFHAYYHRGWYRPHGYFHGGYHGGYHGGFHGAPHGGGHR